MEEKSFEESLEEGMPEDKDSSKEDMETEPSSQSAHKEEGEEEKEWNSFRPTSSPPPSSTLPPPTTSTLSPRPPSPLSSSAAPSQPLPDFMNALNMQPVSKDEDNDKDKSVDIDDGALKIDEGDQDVEGGGEGQGGARKIIETLGPGPKEVLIEKFKRDPDGVLTLLQSALSMDKLSSLLKDEHLRDTQLLPQLQNRLEAAYHTLRECQDSKVSLAEKIKETNQRIGKKRKHLEELRGELKILGDEELKLKKQRDISHTKYSELKKRLQCSTDALQQIALVTKTTPTGSQGDAHGNGGAKTSEPVNNAAMVT